jgi:HlyD family secretion protein
MRETTLKFEQQNLELLKQTRAAQEEQSLKQWNIAKTRLAQLEENIDDEKDISRFSLESAKANLLRVQSTLNNQKERLEWTTILAPMSGTIINLQVEEGEIVTSGRSAFSQSPPLMEIVDLSKMVVKTSINEVDMEKLKVGQPAEIQLRAYPDRVYRGEVREISPSGQPRDNIIYFEVLVAVLGSPQELRPGMTADVDIVVVERQNALLLPIEAVNSERAMTGRGAGTNTPVGSRSGRKYYVMLVANSDKDDTAESNVGEGVKTYIEVGEANDTEIEIVSGLREGDQVLVAGSPPVELAQQRRR